MFKPCIVIPHFNHTARLTEVLRKLEPFGLPLVIVDDGSSPEQVKALREYLQRYKFVALKELTPNCGKGAAVTAGLFLAQELGFTHAIQIDADGQHDLGALAGLVALSQKYPLDLISGYPVYDENVPRVRKWSRYLTHIWVWIETLSFSIRDSMCGFRVYPLEASCTVLRSAILSPRMAFDSEVMVRLYWQGVRVRQLPVAVSYPADGLSHFLMFKDNVLISWAHTRLFFGMLKRFPKLIFRAR